MHCIPRHIRFSLALSAGMLGAHLPGLAQVRVCSFSERGRVFLSAPTVWFAAPSAQRQALGGSSTESASWAYGTQRFTALNLGGQYFFHGFSLGYTLAAGMTPKADISPAGSGFINRQRDYMADIQGQIGFVVLRAGTFCLIPTYGYGYGGWFSRYQQLAIPDPATHQVHTEDRDVALVTGHAVHDIGMQALYTLWPRPDGGTRFALNLKGGYKTYVATAKSTTGGMTYNTPDSPIGTKGWYIQLGLGVGLIWDKYMVKPKPVD